MFDDVPKGNVEDIFSAAPDTSPSPVQKISQAPQGTGAPEIQEGEIRSTVPSQALHSAPVEGRATNSMQPPPILEANTGGARRIVMVVAGVLMLGITGGGAWWYMARDSATESVMSEQEAAESTPSPIDESPVSLPPQQVETLVPTPEATEPPPNEEVQDPPQETTVPPVVPEEDIPAIPPGPLDQDHDGLTDDEEIIAGTSQINVDTDGDGLFDYEEVKVYRTNPIREDSDSDGFSDGQEVRNGYNPLGPGKISGPSDR